MRVSLTALGCERSPAATLPRAAGAWAHLQPERSERASAIEQRSRSGAKVSTKSLPICAVKGLHAAGRLQPACAKLTIGGRPYATVYVAGLSWWMLGFRRTRYKAWLQHVATLVRRHLCSVSSCKPNRGDVPRVGAADVIWSTSRARHRDAACSCSVPRSSCHASPGHGLMERLH